MGISISGSNAISGLGGNDTDFDKVLSQLKKIEQTQLNRLEAWKSDWNLRYESFTQIIEQIQAASSMLSQLSDKNNFVTKLVQSSNDNIITAVANASAQDVQHTIKVNQVASNAIWANTGHVFDSRTDVINDTGQEQYFSYTYAGKRYDFKVPANTTLESFASMINNSADNPGIKVSLIQTGKGYVFQVAGTSTGVENDLIIHDSNLVGMKASGSTSTWQTNASLNIGETVTDPTSYTFDLILQGGSKKSVTVKGNATKEELVRALNNAAGGINASVDSNGNLTIDGVQSFTRREAGQTAYTPPSTRVLINGEFQNSSGFVKLNDPTQGIAAGLSDDDLLKFDLVMADGGTRTVEIKAGATKKELMAAMAQATQDGTDVNISMESDGYGINLKGVTEVKGFLPDGSSLTGGMSTKLTPASGEKATLGASTTYSTTITLNQDMLDKRIDGAESGDGKDLTFALIKDDGTPVYIRGLKGDNTNNDLMDAIKAELESQGISYDDTDGKLTIDGIKEFRLYSGSTSKQGWETSLKASVSVPATTGVEEDGDLFYVDPSSGKYLLEKSPDLVYVITSNDGRKGQLTLPSGTAMKDVLQAMANPGGAEWEWTGADGSPAPVPADFKIRFTDSDGNEYLDASGNPLAPENIDGPIYFQIDGVQSVSGPGMSGQIAKSSNWSIQRAANSRYQIDNWPVEMESSTNKISDVIEGVVFNIQDVGEARMTVSTDITSVEQSIQNFLDAVNSVLITVNDLMKYDENKQVTSNDPDDIGNDNYSASGLTNQKGNLLTGNYGVQLFKSRFSSVLGTTPPGFQSRTSADNILSGDILASLANLGIKTDTDSTSDTYGLLVMAPSSSIAAMQELDKENYTNMITNHLEAVVDFFCASGSGATTSTDFRYGSHVEGITKAGSYEVRYNVDEKGNITDVTVGGVPAKRDESQPGNYYSVASGDARGLSILIDDLTVGQHPPAGEEPMYVRIKQGLVQTTNNFLKGELVFNDINIPANATQQQIEDALALKSKNGALMSLRDNYKTVMESIDVKIEREQRRISTWEARQKKIFANLETLLNQYGEQQKQLEGQLAQLSSSK